MPVVRHLVEALLNPLFLVALLFVSSLILLWMRGNSLMVWTGFLLALAILLVSSTGWLPQELTRRLEEQYRPIKQADSAVQWVVVLSGGQSEVKNVPTNNLLYAATIKRLIEGVRLYRQLPEAKLLLSGGSYGFSTSEAQRMSELSSWFAIPSERIILETGSVNTADQAREIKQILGEQPFYLVTSAIHMPRSMALCQAQGLRPIAAPTDYTYYWNDERWEKTYLPNPQNLLYLSIALHELLGRAWAKLHGNFQQK